MSNNNLVLNKRIFTLLVILVTCFFSIMANSQSNSLAGLNTQGMRVKLNEINQMTLKNSNNYEGLSQTLHEINELQPVVVDCIISGQKKLIKINNLLHAIELSKSTQQDSQSYNYLLKEKSIKSSQIASCSFINYRLEEIRNINNNNINTVSKSKLLKRIPVWDNFNIALLGNLYIDTSMLYKRSGLEQINIFNGIGLFLTFMAGLIIALALKKYSNSSVSPVSNIIAHYLFGILPFGLVCIYMSILFAHTNPTPLTISWINSLAIYLITLFITKLCLTFGLKENPWPKAIAVFEVTVLICTIIYFFTLQYFQFSNIPVPLKFVDFTCFITIAVILRIMIALITNSKQWLTEQLMLTLQKRVFFVATLTLLCYLGNSMLALLTLPPEFFTIVDTLFITLLNVTYAYILSPLLKHFIHETKGKHASMALKLICLSTIVAAWCGYHYFAIMFVPDLIITVVTLIIIWEIKNLLHRIYIQLSDPNQFWSQKLRYILGIKTDKKLMEILVIIVITTLPAIIFGVLGILEIWGLTRYQVSVLFLAIHNGTTMFGTTIRPAMIFRAASLFCFLILTGRAISTYIFRHTLITEEKHTQIMITSIISYVSFIVALLVALYIAGINLKNIMVIAGALSVGLGFGLQSFARDFISGLIIMFNKPIKIGDHIEVGDRNRNEGFIKKIGALSTQLHTLSHADVIIPNSEIITKVITNFTFHNNVLSRIKITVTLDKDSDFEHSRQVLLDIATQNPHVMHEPPYEPVVLFELYDLNLWCVINDVNNKEKILSDLNLAIATAFKDLPDKE